MGIRHLIIAVMLILMLSVPAFSVNFIIGAKAGYYVWEPYLKEIDASGFAQIDKGTGFLYGPVVSALLTQDFSLSLAALTGKQSTHWKVKYNEWEGQYLTGNYHFDSRRTDIDSALSYRVMQNLKVFLGYKYQHIVSKLSYTEIRTDSNKDIIDGINITDSEIKTPSHGPALGVGFSLPFGKGFFATVNLSGLYMKGHFEISDDWSYKYESVSVHEKKPEENFKLDTRQTGLNFEPSIGYSADNGLIFTLGFRYQWLKTEYLDDFPGEDKPLPDANDYLYGVFVSVLYSI